MVPSEDSTSELTDFAKVSCGIPVHVQWSYFTLCIKFCDDFVGEKKSV